MFEVLYKCWVNYVMMVSDVYSFFCKIVDCYVLFYLMLLRVLVKIVVGGLVSWECLLKYFLF